MEFIAIRQYNWLSLRPPNYVSSLFVLHSSLKLAFPSSAELRFFTLHLNSSLFTLHSSLKFFTLHLFSSLIFPEPLGYSGVATALA